MEAHNGNMVHPAAPRRRRAVLDDAEGHQLGRHDQAICRNLEWIDQEQGEETKLALRCMLCAQAGLLPTSIQALPACVRTLGRHIQEQCPVAHISLQRALTGPPDDGNGALRDYLYTQCRRLGIVNLPDIGIGYDTHHPPVEDDEEPLPLAETKLVVDYDVPPSFPFFRDTATEEWLCKHCAHVPPSFRDPQYCWSIPAGTPPPTTFVDNHIRQCRYYPDKEASPDVAMYNPHQSAEQRHQAAIQVLKENDKSMYDSNGAVLPEEERLFNRDDGLLLTDYLLYLMTQLRGTRFTESDRRTRGGKRDSIVLGYGGMECVHCCSEGKQARKFFWSSVDRLSNSFAEIPGHILKCRQCPELIRDALLILKESHAKQMQALPRGSQKVFFKRMWKRLHAKDPLPTAKTPPKSTRGLLLQVDTSPTTLYSELSGSFVEGTTEDKARALAAAAVQPDRPSPTSRVRLSLIEDREWLPDYECLIREQIEVFCASSEDAEAFQKLGVSVTEGQVCLRCTHCALRADTTAGAMTFPETLSTIYDHAHRLVDRHLLQRGCAYMPPAAKNRLTHAHGQRVAVPQARAYYVSMSKALGLQDTVAGVRAGATPVPMRHFFSRPALLDPSSSEASLLHTEDDISPTSHPSPDLKRMADDSVPDSSEKRIRSV